MGIPVLTRTFHLRIMTYVMCFALKRGSTLILLYFEPNIGNH